MRKIIYISFFNLFFSGITIAQQSAQFSQYLYNTSTMNPAYGGSNDRMSFMLMQRSQWMGMNGAPSSQAFTFNSPLLNQKLNAGVYVLNESIGARQFTTAQASGAYHIRMKGSSLSFGLRAGIFSWRVDKDKLQYENNSDPASLMNASNSISPNFDAGIFYNGKNLFGGISAFNLTEPVFFTSVSGTGIETGNKLIRHYFAIAGYRLKINENLIMRPSVLVKYTTAAPLNIDGNIAFILKERFHFAATYRTSKMASIMFEMYINDKIRFGYAFDYTFNDLKNYAPSGSHELFIGYDIFGKAKPLVTTRFL